MINPSISPNLPKVKTCQIKHLIYQNQSVIWTDLSFVLTAGIQMIDWVDLPQGRGRQLQRKLRSALLASHVHLPKRRLSIQCQLNTLPIKNHLDIALALGILAVQGHPKAQEQIKTGMHFGHLNVDGRILPVAGILPLVQYALQHTDKRLYLPEDTKDIMSLLHSERIVYVRHLTDLIGDHQPTRPVILEEQTFTKPLEFSQTFLDLNFQTRAIRGLVLACGIHLPICLYGAKGTGKTTLGRLAQTLMPSLHPADWLFKIYHLSFLAYAKQSDSDFIAEYHPHTSCCRWDQLNAIGCLNLDQGLKWLSHGFMWIDDAEQIDLKTAKKLASIVRDQAAPTGLIALESCACGKRFNPKLDCTCSKNELKRYNFWLETARSIQAIFIHLSGMHIIDMAERPLDVQVLKKRVQYLHDALYPEGHLAREAKDDHPDLRSQQILSWTAAAQADLKRYQNKHTLNLERYLQLMKLSQGIAIDDHAPAVETAHLAEAITFL